MHLIQESERVLAGCAPASPGPPLAAREPHQGWNRARHPRGPVDASSTDPILAYHPSSAAPTPLLESVGGVQFTNWRIRTLFTVPSMAATINRFDPP